VSLERTLFLDFLKHFVNMHLIVSFTGRKKTHLRTYGSKVMDVWSFKENSRQGGHVLEPTSKSWPLAQKVKGMKKNGNSPTCAGIDSQSPAGRRLTPVLVGLFQIF
jgi:hypothetical protein